MYMFITPIFGSNVEYFTQLLKKAISSSDEQQQKHSYTEK